MSIAKNDCISDARLEAIIVRSKWEDVLIEVEGRRTNW